MTTLLRKIRRTRRRSERLRCPAHLKFVRTFHCLVAMCGGTPVEAAHWRLGAHAGISQKPDDSRCVPLCPYHHREAHRIGEATFEAKYCLSIEGSIAALQRESSPLRRYWAKMRKVA